MDRENFGLICEPNGCAPEIHQVSFHESQERQVILACVAEPLSQHALLAGLDSDI